MKSKLRQISTSWYFFASAVFIYILLLIFYRELFFASTGYVYNIFIKILPFFVLAFILMTLTNYFITPKYLLKHFKGRGIKKWVFIIISGILSSGPVYMWYPLLADLRKKGLSYGLIACFLYNKAIKIPLMPLLILYFGWKYFLVLSTVMVFFSILQGNFINKLMNLKYENSNSS
jgi:uncharacterized membrane protein YraQ (UPF0718 family)